MNYRWRSIAELVDSPKALTCFKSLTALNAADVGFAQYNFELFDIIAHTADIDGAKLTTCTPQGPLEAPREDKAQD